MMMNSRPVLHALSECEPLFMWSDNDTDAFTGESFRAFTCIDQRALHPARQIWQPGKWPLGSHLASPSRISFAAQSS